MKRDVWLSMMSVVWFAMVASTLLYMVVVVE
jgi:hypothetical protein